MIVPQVLQVYDINPCTPVYYILQSKIVPQELQSMVLTQVVQSMIVPQVLQVYDINPGTPVYDINLSTPAYASTPGTPVYDIYLGTPVYDSTPATPVYDSTLRNIYNLINPQHLVRGKQSQFSP